MQIEGIGDNRRSMITQICQLVSEADGFGVDHFRKLVREYKEVDQTLHQILEGAIDLADRNYEHHLNARILGVSAGYSPLAAALQLSEGDILKKAISELRERQKNETEYCCGFLSPSIQQTAREHDRNLMKLQREELKRQRKEAREKARKERGSRWFGIGF